MVEAGGKVCSSMALSVVMGNVSVLVHSVMIHILKYEFAAKLL